MNRLPGQNSALTNVLVVEPQDEDTIMYDSNLKLWKNIPMPVTPPVVNHYAESFLLWSQTQTIPGDENVTILGDNPSSSTLPPGSAYHGMNFNPSTGEYTCLFDAIYRVTLSGKITSSSASNTGIGMFQRRGSDTYAAGLFTDFVLPTGRGGGSWVLSADAGDIFLLRAYATGATAPGPSGTFRYSIEWIAPKV